MRKNGKETGQPGQRYVIRNRKGYGETGHYSKIGGGDTPHLQEAQVFGWNVKQGRGWYGDKYQELLPVTIVLAEVAK